MNLADDAFVEQKGILLMLAYLVLLCIFLGYCLITFWPPPSLLKISSLEPANAQSGASVTITGAGFADGVRVWFDDVSADHVTKIDGTLLKVEVPKHIAGDSKVTVANPGPPVSSSTKFHFDADKPVTPTAPDGSNPPSGGAGGTAAATTGASEKPRETAATHADSGAGAKGTVAAAATGGPPPGTAVVSFFWCSLRINENVRLLILVMVVGALGSLIHVFRSFFWYVGNRTLKDSWLLMYFLLPFTGAGLAVLFYLIIRGGISSQAPANPSSLDGYAAIAALVGMFSQEAMLKLKQIAGAFFTPAEQGKDQAVETPVINAVDTPQGPAAGGTTVNITGSGFAKGNQVAFGGVAATTVTVTSGTRITATTPPHAAGAVDVEVTNSAGMKGTLPASFTFQ